MYFAYIFEHTHRLLLLHDLVLNLFVLRLKPSVDFLINDPVFLLTHESVCWLCGEKA